MLIVHTGHRANRSTMCNGKNEIPIVQLSVACVLSACQPSVPFRKLNNISVVCHHGCSWVTMIKLSDSCCLKCFPSSWHDAMRVYKLLGRSLYTSPFLKLPNDFTLGKIIQMWSTGLHICHITITRRWQLHDLQKFDLNLSHKCRGTLPACFISLCVLFQHQVLHICAWPTVLDTRLSLDWSFNLICLLILLLCYFFYFVLNFYTPVCVY